MTNPSSAQYSPDNSKMSEGVKNQNGPSSRKTELSADSGAPDPTSYASCRICGYGCPTQVDFENHMLTHSNQADPTSVASEQQVYQLWKLLDDIDTLDDAVKSNDKAFREHARTIQRKRFEIVNETDVDALYTQYHTVSVQPKEPVASEPITHVKFDDNVTICGRSLYQLDIVELQSEATCWLCAIDSDNPRRAKTALTERKPTEVKGVELEELANELADHYYEQQRYTANSRWQECYDEAKQQLQALTTKAVIAEAEEILKNISDLQPQAYLAIERIKGHIAQLKAEQLNKEIL